MLDRIHWQKRGLGVVAILHISSILSYQIFSHFGGLWSVFHPTASTTDGI
jgi:hypothetical protein